MGLTTRKSARILLGCNFMSEIEFLNDMRILQRYPQAKRTRADKLVVGDVICFHVEVPCTYVTSEIVDLKSESNDWVWVIATCG